MHPSAATSRARARYCCWLPPHPCTKRMPGTSVPGVTSVPATCSSSTGMSMTSSRVGMIHERVFGEGSHARVDILVVDGGAGRRLDAVAIELDGAGAHGLAGRVRLQHGQGFDLGPARAADAPGLLQHPDAAAPMSIEPFRHVV